VHGSYGRREVFRRGRGGIGASALIEELVLNRDPESVYVSGFKYEGDYHILIFTVCLNKFCRISATPKILRKGLVKISIGSDRLAAVRKNIVCMYYGELVFLKI